MKKISFIFILILCIICFSCKSNSSTLGEVGELECRYYSLNETLVNDRGDELTILDAFVAKSVGYEDKYYSTDNYLFIMKMYLKANYYKLDSIILDSYGISSEDIYSGIINVELTKMLSPNLDFNTTIIIDNTIYFCINISQEDCEFIKENDYNINIRLAGFRRKNGVHTINKINYKDISFYDEYIVS